MPNIITPNNDRLNDAFRIPGLPQGPWRLRIYSRWGKQVYLSNDYQQDWTAQGLPDGTYYYLLEHATLPPRKGWLQVSR